jgi:hypothetical protein
MIALVGNGASRELSATAKKLIVGEFLKGTRISDIAVQNGVHALTVESIIRQGIEQLLELKVTIAQDERQEPQTV